MRLVPVSRTRVYRLGLSVVTWAALCMLGLVISMLVGDVLSNRVVSSDVIIRGVREYRVIVWLRLLGLTRCMIVRASRVKLSIRVSCRGLALVIGARTYGWLLNRLFWFVVVLETL